MNLNKRNLIIGIGFLMGSVICIVSMFTHKMETYYITGLFLFTVIGIAFLKKSKS